MKRIARKRLLAALLAVALCLPVLFASCSGGHAPYVFRVNGTDIAIDAKAEPILSALGAPVSRKEQPSCLFSKENDILYVYPDFSLMVYQKNSVEYVYTITLKSDASGLATPEGISVGADRSAVLAAYGGPSEESRSGLRYDADGMSLYFFFSGDALTRVEYRRAE